MPTYNKLVRDKIPAIIEIRGSSCRTRILDEQEYKLELQKKLGEELQEYLAASNDKDSIEELADLLELIHAAVTIHGSSMEELEVVRVKKAEDRGGFKERIFLIDTQDA